MPFEASKRLQGGLHRYMGKVKKFWPSSTLIIRRNRRLKKVQAQFAPPCTNRVNTQTFFKKLSILCEQTSYHKLTIFQSFFLTLDCLVIIYQYSIYPLYIFIDVKANSEIEIHNFTHINSIKIENKNSILLNNETNLKSVIRNHFNPNSLYF